MAAGILSAVGAILSSASADPVVLAQVADAQLGHPATPQEATAISAALTALAKSKDPTIMEEMKRMKGHRIYGHRIY